MIKKVVATAAVTGSLMMAGAGLAVADSGADAKAAAVGSPGIISGNDVQVPIGIPVDLCNNTINIVALLNPAFGSTCVNA
ncbi:chaplin [Streptomyces sp. NBC_01803]|uniref:chaplin n=1 Tax=Streptomyces sp. NBC_01803 TaxID=2975946 RepID=UPI002DD7A23F|nr:chaplin [Streptomyces sp. NBC_01803]WSA47027.1 chaplin [Streptomyces sp. NBC_01803]